MIAENLLFVFSRDLIAFIPIFVGILDMLLVIIENEMSFDDLLINQFKCQRRIEVLYDIILIA